MIRLLRAQVADDPKVSKNEILDATDQKALVCSTAAEAAKGAQAILILTEWDEFKTYDYAEHNIATFIPH